MQSPSTTTSTTSAGTTTSTSTTIQITTSTTTLLVTTTSSSTSTSTSTSSSTTTSTTLYCHPALTTSTTQFDCSCIHPIDYIFQKIDEYRKLNDVSFLVAIQDALTNGFLIDSCDFCCPDCDIYYLGEVEEYLKLRETDIILEGCCENIYASVETYLKYFEAFDPANQSQGQTPNFLLQNVRCCSTSFNHCIDELLKYFTDNNCVYISDSSPDPSSNSPFSTTLMIDDIIRDLGIIEFGSFFGKTQICRLIQNLAYYSPNKCFLDELSEFLKLGLVIDCEGGKLVAASVDTYIVFALASGKIPQA